MNTPNKPENARKKKSRKGKYAFQERLLDGETVISTGKISAGIYWKPLAVLIIALLFALFIAVELGAVLAIFGLMLVTGAVLKKEILMLVVTNKRIFVRYGILQVDVVDIHYDKVESIELERMLPGYIMGYANVVIMGTGNRFIVIPYVSNSVEVRRDYNAEALREKEVQDVRVVSDSGTKAAPQSKPAKNLKDKDGNVEGENFVMKD